MVLCVITIFLRFITISAICVQLATNNQFVSSQIAQNTQASSKGYTHSIVQTSTGEYAHILLTQASYMQKQNKKASLALEQQAQQQLIQSVTYPSIEYQPITNSNSQYQILPSSSLQTDLLTSEHRQETSERNTLDVNHRLVPYDNIETLAWVSTYYDNLKALDYRVGPDSPELVDVRELMDMLLEAVVWSEQL